MQALTEPADMESDSDQHAAPVIAIGGPAASADFVPARRSRPGRWLPRPRDVALTAVVGVAILAVAYLFTAADEGAASSWSVSVAGGGQGPPPAVGQPAPDFQVRTLDGGTARLSDFRGRPVWLNFFATWCPPWRAENPDIQATYLDDQQRGGDLVVLSLSLGESPTTVRDYVQKAGLTYTFALDSDTTIAARYRVTGIPTHVFIDRDGVVRYLRNGGLQRAQMSKELDKIR